MARKILPTNVFDGGILAAESGDRPVCQTHTYIAREIRKCFPSAKFKISYKGRNIFLAYLNGLLIAKVIAKRRWTVDGGMVNLKVGRVERGMA